jgi:hypothetical protein
MIPELFDPGRRKDPAECGWHAERSGSAPTDGTVRASRAGYAAEEYVP